MEILETQLLELAVLILKKAKIERYLRKTFRCFLRKCFSCCGMKNIENELKYLNEAISELQQQNNIEKNSLMKITEL